MKFLAIIPARSGSKGIKDKNIINFFHKPLIYWTIQSAIKCKLIDKVVVSTDSKKIKDLSIKYGAEVPFFRPKKYSGDEAKTLDAINYTIKKLEKDENYFADYIITLQPTSPLRKKKNIEESIKKIIKDKKADSLVSCVQVPHNFLPECLMTYDGKYIKSLAKDKKTYRRQEKRKLLARNGAAIYITKRKKISKYIFGGKTIPYFMSAVESIDIDDQDDLRMAKIARNFLIKGK